MKVKAEICWNIEPKGHPDTPRRTIYLTGDMKNVLFISNKLGFEFSDLHQNHSIQTSTGFGLPESIKNIVGFNENNARKTPNYNRHSNGKGYTGTTLCVWEGEISLKENS